MVPSCEVVSLPSLPGPQGLTAAKPPRQSQGAAANLPGTVPVHGWGQALCRGQVSQRVYPIEG